MDFLRSRGMGQGWCTNLVLPDELPTFYVDDPREHTGPARPANPPPPPSDSKPQEDLFAYVQVMVQKEMARQQQEMRMPPTKKRKRAARRKPVKVEKVETEGSSHDDTDSDGSVEVIEKSASTAHLMATRAQRHTTIYESANHNECNS